MEDGNDDRGEERMTEERGISFSEREALKREIFSQMRCALPGKVVSFDAGMQTACIQPGVISGGVVLPLLTDVPVFMPVSFGVNAGDACLVIFADVDIDAWLESGNPEEPGSERMHSLADGFAFVGFKAGGGG